MEPMMEDKSIVRKKSKAFASRIVKLGRYLHETQKEFILSKQVIRSGTSIGANLAEAQYAASKSDFVNKLRISLKECSETMFWLELLEENGYLGDSEFLSLKDDCRELLKLLVSSVRTLVEKPSETRLPRRRTSRTPPSDIAHSSDPASLSDSTSSSIPTPSNLWALPIDPFE